MKMGKIEKWFMNRPQHDVRTINRAEKLLNLTNFKEKQKFLEVGCGSGAVSKYIAKKYLLNVTGTDIDPEQVQLAQENIDDIPDIHFLETDATNLPFQDNDPGNGDLVDCPNFGFSVNPFNDFRHIIDILFLDVSPKRG